MIKIGGLWLKEGKKGKFFSGKFGNANVLIFKNTNKKEAKHPDYEIFIAEPRPRNEAPQGAKTPAQANNQSAWEDDIPF